MASANFIDLPYLKANTAITGNVDATELLPFIQEAQSVWIQDLIGTRLYEKLQNDIAAVDASPSVALPATSLTLLNKIAPALSYYTLYTALPFIFLKLKNKGVMKNANPETGAQSASMQEVNFLRESVLGSAKFHGERVVTFLCNKSEDYPEYRTQGDDADIYPRGTAYDNFGIYTGPSKAEFKELKKYIG